MYFNKFNNAPSFCVTVMIFSEILTPVANGEMSSGIISGCYGELELYLLY